ncbi:MAG: division/cell wall cluster transcriptional repressor MraZ [Chloroflexota bacterium]
MRCERSQLWELSDRGSDMFLGEYERNVDEKGRLAIPVELRAGLANGAVLTRSFDTCLCIYPAAKWETLARAVDDLPQTRYEVRVLARSLFSGAVPCDFDRQGRVVIPAYLREHAGIKGDVVVAGVFSRIELWNGDAWIQQRQKFGDEASRLAEVMSTSSA